MKRNIVSRRHMIGGCACLSLAKADAALAAAPAAKPVSISVTGAMEALDRLKAGNSRFWNGHQIHAHENAEWRNILVADQKPFATILGCSDSRVPPELVFDLGLGELFIIRLAGNIIAEDVLGSLQYAIHHLHTPLVVVMGHEGCGAVTAAVDSMLSTSHEPSHIEALLEMIKPGLTNVDLKQERKALLRSAVEANVRWSMKELLLLPEAQRALKERRAALVGAVYELESGKVRFLDH